MVRYAYEGGIGWLEAGCVLLFNPMFSVYIYVILLVIAILITGVNLILTAVLMSKTKSAIAAGMIEM